MANEATLVTQLQDRLPECTVAAGVTIAKGTVLALLDNNVGTASSSDGNIFLGIAASEKDGSDNSTKLGYFDKGIFKMTDSGTGITAGDVVKIAGVNTIATADEDGAQDLKEVVGIALETATSGQSIEVKLK